MIAVGVVVVFVFAVVAVLVCGCRCLRRGKSCGWWHADPMHGCTGRATEEATGTQCTVEPSCPWSLLLFLLFLLLLLLLVVAAVVVVVVSVSRLRLSAFRPQPECKV